MKLSQNEVPVDYDHSQQDKQRGWLYLTGSHTAIKLDRDSNPFPFYPNSTALVMNTFTKLSMKQRNVKMPFLWFCNYLGSYIGGGFEAGVGIWPDCRSSRSPGPQSICRADGTVSHGTQGGHGGSTQPDPVVWWILHNPAYLRPWSWVWQISDS